MKRNRITHIIGIAFFGFYILNACTQDHADKLNGPLRVSERNPGYFTDDSGKAVYLTGSHTWNNLVDMSPDPQMERFDYPAYIQWMKKYNHNFFRLWAWELLNWDTGANSEDDAKNHQVGPHPWIRSGPGMALDGKPKFDFEQLNDNYFKRLKDRIAMAADSGIYVSIYAI